MDSSSLLSYRRPVFPAFQPYIFPFSKNSICRLMLPKADLQFTSLVGFQQLLSPRRCCRYSMNVLFMYPNDSGNNTSPALSIFYPHLPAGIGFRFFLHHPTFPLFPALFLIIHIVCFTCRGTLPNPAICLRNSLFLLIFSLSLPVRCILTKNAVACISSIPHPALINLLLPFRYPNCG